MILLFGALVFPFFQSSLFAAENISREEVIAKYEASLDLADQYQIYEEDPLNILPKLRIASKALLDNQLNQADKTLDVALEEFKKMAAQPTRFKAEKYWFEIYIDAIQKYVVLALLAYFLVKWRYFRRMLEANKIRGWGRIIFAFIMVMSAITLSLVDISRYGESAWAVFDIQVVFVGILGLLGGVVTGVAGGIALGIFRLILKPELFIYFLIPVIIGLLGGFLSRWIRSFQLTGKISLAAGVLMGLVHGSILYLPLMLNISWVYLAFIIVFIAFVEGLGVFIFCSVMSGVLRQVSHQEIEQELLKTKLLFLQSQIRPHFLFNALNTISAISARENAVEAKRLILRLSDFFRRTVRREEEMVTLKDEIQEIDDYLEIEKARFQDRLQIEKDIQIPEFLWSQKLPLLVIQPLIENAIGHGISKKEEGGKVQIKIRQEGTDLKIEIIDNGKGVDPEKMQQILKGEHVSSPGEGAGIGVKNIHQRLIRYYGPSYGLQYERISGGGTKVSLRIPLR